MKLGLACLCVMILAPDAGSGAAKKVTGPLAAWIEPLASKLPDQQAHRLAKTTLDEKARPCVAFSIVASTVAFDIAPKHLRAQEMKGLLPKPPAPVEARIDHDRPRPICDPVPGDPCSCRPCPEPVMPQSRAFEQLTYALNARDDAAKLAAYDRAVAFVLGYLESAKPRLASLKEPPPAPGQFRAPRLRILDPRRLVTTLEALVKNPDACR